MGMGNTFIDTETGEIYTEELQTAPWSSGPMIFTQLMKEGREKSLFSWVEEDRYEGEYIDYKNGKMWV